jgi:aminoglycoside phosphotransferase (APT) family kinase protein
VVQGGFLAAPQWTPLRLDSKSMIEQVSAALVKAGFPHDPGALELHFREARLAVRMPHDRMAWFPSNEEGRALLTKERRVLRLLERYCKFSAPRVLYEDATGWDLRALVQGAVAPMGLYERIVGDSSFARAFGEDLGRMLAEQHSGIPLAELAGWLPAVPNWPRPDDLPHLAQVIDDLKLLAKIERALEARAELTRTLQDPVLVHADVGLHNIAVDPASYRAVGLFDYEGAVFGDRHQDFAYMLFPVATETMLEGARATYESAIGLRIDRDRVRFLNAVAAIGFLAFRHGHPSDEAWCGRTLAQDLAWTNDALERAGI